MIHRTANLDGQIGRRRKPANSPRWIFIPTPSCSFSVLLVLTARFFTCRSNHSSSPIPYPMMPMIFSIAATLRLCSAQANRGSLMSCLAPHCEYCILGNRRLTTIGLTGSSSLAPTPHCLFAHQTFIASRIHVRAPSFSVALAVAVAVAGNVAIDRYSSTRTFGSEIGVLVFASWRDRRSRLSTLFLKSRERYK